MKTKLSAQWKQDELELTQGSEGWLDDEGWKTLKRRVYRIEAAFKKPGSDKKIYADYYFVELNHLQTIIVETFTVRDDHLVCRKNAEDVIRSFELFTTQRRPDAPATGIPAPPGAAPPGAAPPAAGPASATQGTTRDVSPSPSSPAPSSPPR